MNIKKIIKYTLIAVPLLFLVECGAESRSYASDKFMEANLRSVDKIKLYGKTSFGEECKLIFHIKYVPNSSFGMRKTKWIKVSSNIKTDGTYETVVDKKYSIENSSTWQAETLIPELQCQGYSQGGRAMLYLSDKTTLTKRTINCTKEENKNSEKTITCAVANTHSIGFEEISSLQKEIEVNIVDKGLNIPYYQLIK